MSAKNTSVSLGKVKLELKTGNIAMLHADAIVNPANELLNLGIGVSGAISQVGGSAIQKECSEIGFCATGSAVMTTAGNLNARYVIHAVGPMYGEGGENEKLRSAVNSALNLADEKGLTSIALPAISAGLFHFPMDGCAKVMIGAIKDTAPKLKTLNHITICLHSDKKFDVFEKALNG
jgi:O-acetyl-ADP-ribose deacetylase (regulator of RNase III)